MKDAERFGLDPAAFGIPEAPPDRVPIWPDMREAFALFCDAPWFWVGVGLGGLIRTHIDRVQLEAAARGLGITLTPAIYTDIRIMEAAAIEEWSRRR